MLEQLLPQVLDNSYRGQKLALWLFGIVLLMRVGISLNTIFNGRSVAISADGIPLDSFTPAGAQTVVSLFALLGLAKLTLSLVGIVALARYRSAIPFLFALLLLEHLARTVIVRVLPVARVGTPPGLVVNLVLLALMVAGLALSLVERSGAPAQG